MKKAHEGKSEKICIVKREPKKWKNPRNKWTHEKYTQENDSRQIENFTTQMDTQKSGKSRKNYVQKNAAQTFNIF